VTRRTSAGHVYEADQVVTLDEAIAMYTRTAAEVCGLGDRGALEPGKRADLVVLDSPLTTNSLESAHVRATVLAGDVVHGTLDAIVTAR
jgi:predicted amidohydrolase YtcJ